jgi:hypothetical protein
MKKVLLPVFTAVISIFFLIGTTGITVIVRNCNCCGPSVETGIFKAVAHGEKGCCGGLESQSSIPGTQSIEGKCCTYLTKNLKLNNYITSEKINFSVNFDIQAPAYISKAYEVPSIYLKPLSYHNKHGGRDLVVSNCQYLI